MKSTPIAYSATMVPPVLADTKTQTRRIVNPQPGPEFELFKADTGRFWLNRHDPPHNIEAPIMVDCPYGQPGDLLWVRESYFQFGHWEPVEGKKTKGGKQKWRFVPDSTQILFNPSDVPGGSWRLGRHHLEPFKSAWHERLGRFMPRTASRITLEIVSVRVERLQEISEEDAKAEGVVVTEDRSHSHRELGIPYRPNVNLYEGLWESINGPGSWAANPWVWVVEFRRLQP